jgi:lipopolysaccharide transport system ATP-binding protein
MGLRGPAEDRSADASSDVLLRVETVSKRFCRSLRRSLWYGIGDVLRDLNPLAVRPAEPPLRRDEFWALKDVSFELRRGECLGLIGRNGAGKTTLLKMLNGLIKPDAGCIAVRGRVGALIALGAGFNPVLTGRENIYVNGSVLGLTSREIAKRVDEIVEFSEIREFIDTPVQNYSSGMQVRLGFAVATALQPDVLLLDEVLAVGDAAFRAKCYDRLASMRRQAAFVLVSHDTDQIARVCSRVLVLNRGREHFLGETGPGIEAYHELSRERATVASHEHTAAGILASLDACDAVVGRDGFLTLSVSLHLPETVPMADVRVVLLDDTGLPACDAYTRTQEQSLRLEEGPNRINCTVGPLQLKRGRYLLSVAVLNRATNLHLYWGDRVRLIEALGPVSGAVAYAPALNCELGSPAALPRRCD